MPSSGTGSTGTSTAPTPCIPAKPGSRTSTTNARPLFIGEAALIRSVETAYAAFRDGCDGLVTMWTVYRDMMEHPLTDQWNQTFMDEWVDMHENGMLEGLPVRL